MRLITLTTDFGSRDWFVGTMKGVIARLAPRTRVVDLNHEVPPGDIVAGAFSLQSSYSFFPKGTIHVAIVDPGVGSRRHPVAVRTENFYFVGPDNGLLAWALRKERVLEIRRLENARFFLHRISNTFHGRDIFSPVAAHLSRRNIFKQLGPSAEVLDPLPWPEPRMKGTQISGEILYFDRFGNGITNIPNEMAGVQEGKRCRAGSARRATIPVVSFYQAVPAGAAAAVPGSTGYVEIAVNGGSAERDLKLRRGTAVVVLPGPV